MSGDPVTVLLGISGVGKSWLARQIAIARPDVLPLSASSLLRARLGKPDDALRTAPPAEMLSNQYELVTAIRAKRDAWPGRSILLEAHAFIDNDRELVDLPVDVFAAIGTSGIMVVVAEPHIIAMRRASDVDRFRPRRTPDELSAQQIHALELAADYSVELSVPYEIVASSDPGRAISVFDAMASRPASGPRD